MTNVWIFNNLILNRNQLNNNLQNTVSCLEGKDNTEYTLNNWRLLKYNRKEEIRTNMYYQRNAYNLELSLQAFDTMRKFSYFADSFMRLAPYEQEQITYGCLFLLTIVRICWLYSNMGRTIPMSFIMIIRCVKMEISGWLQIMTTYWKTERFAHNVNTVPFLWVAMKWVRNACWFRICQNTLYFLWITLLQHRRWI